MIINNISYKQCLDHEEISACIEYDSDEKPFNLFYQFSGDIPGTLIPQPEAFIAACLLIAMKNGEDIVVDNKISRRFFYGLDQIMDIFHAWHKESLMNIEIKHSGLHTTSIRNKNIGCFFTLGVDSFYTLLKNIQTAGPEERISHVIIVQGIDIPLSNNEFFAIVCERIREVADYYNLKIIIIRTNLRQFSDSILSWHTYQGSGLASMALGLMPYFKKFYTSSSDIYSTLDPIGSHPIVDPLWSTETCEYIHDGCEASRMNKILWQISRSPLALKHLRVCFQNAGIQYNCGICEKCVRTMINLEIAGVLDSCETLPSYLDYNKIKEMSASHTRMKEYFPDNILVLRREINNEKLLEILVDSLKNPGNNDTMNALKKQIKNIDTAYLHGILSRIHRGLKF